MRFSSPPASGQIQTRYLLIFTLCAGAILFGLKMMRPDSSAGPPQEPLMVYCAASLKVPVETIARDYEEHYHTPVHLQFGGSQTLLSSIEVTRTGDLYLPADDSYFPLAKSKNLLESTLPVATQSAVLMVAKGNPKGIKTLADLQRTGVRLALTNPDAAAIGKRMREKLGKETWDALAKTAALVTATVTEAANAVKADGADAAFIWDSMQPQYADFVLISLPETAGVEAQVGVGTLTCSKQAEAALQFARYVAAKDTGLAVFKKQGFKIAEGR